MCVCVDDVVPAGILVQSVVHEGYAFIMTSYLYSELLSSYSVGYYIYVYIVITVGYCLLYILLSNNN